MFEPTIIDHDEVITRLISARDRLNPRLVGDAFLASLTTRRLDLRSALGSYSVFRHMPVHRANSAVGACSVCGLFGSSGQSEDLNVLNFERFKWGGVRHDQPLYATLDLELLLKERPPHPTNEDIRLLKLILEALRDAPPSTTSAQVQRFLPKALKSNKPERDVLIALLGLAGVLAATARPGYSSQFVAPRDRALPERRFIDMAYPACWWRAEDGLDAREISTFFGHVL